MNELQRMWKALMKHVLPKLKNTASGVVQVGQVNGNITVHNYHQAPVKVATRSKATPDQKRLLDLLKQVPDRAVILNFMQREFGTSLVIKLEPPQVFRVRRYVETVIASAAEAKPERDAEAEAFSRQHGVKLANEFDAARARRQAKYGKDARRNA